MRERILTMIVCSVISPAEISAGPCPRIGSGFLFNKPLNALLAETQNRRMVHALRATLLHGVPPSPLISAICLASREVTPFFFFYKSRDGSLCAVKGHLDDQMFGFVNVVVP